MSEGGAVTTQPTSKTLLELIDSEIICIDCGEVFVWAAGEQLFFISKNLQNPPKRCKDCKKAKNHRIEAVERAKITGIRPRVEVKVKCARCLTITTIPFYPSQGRPVYCRTCFNNVKLVTNVAVDGI